MAPPARTSLNARPVAASAWKLQEHVFVTAHQIRPSAVIIKPKMPFIKVIAVNVCSFSVCWIWGGQRVHCDTTGSCAGDVLALAQRLTPQAVS